MAGLRTNIIRGGALLSLVVLFTACSEKATCALEGCTKNESKVELKSGDSQNALDAKVDTSKSDKEAIEKAIKDLKDRLELGESIDKVQNDMLHIHETRLAALELKVTQIDTSIAGLNTKIAAAEAAIAANKLEIERVEKELQDAIKAGDDALKAQLTEKMEQLVGAEAELREALAVRVAALEALTEGLNVADIISQLGGLDEKIAEILGVLKGDASAQEGSPAALGLESVVASLSSKASSTRSTLESLIAALGGTINGTSVLGLEKISKLRSDITDLGSKLADHKTKTAQDIADLQTAINNKVSCVIGAPYGGKHNDKFQDITCGGKKIKIELSDD